MSQKQDVYNQMLLNIARGHQGIEPLLDTFFTFLASKTDFFYGADGDDVKATVMKVMERHIDAGAKIRAKKAAENERKTKEMREAAKRRAEQSECAFAVVVWCGVVWCGVVWCGVVWCGVVWRGVAWCGVVWCSVLSRGVVWCGAVWCGGVGRERTGDANGLLFPCLHYALLFSPLTHAHATPLFSRLLPLIRG